MAIDKRLQIYDEQGNLVDYDILASDVKFLPDGKDLPTKLAEMQDAIEDAGSGDGTVTGVKIGSTTYEPTDGVVDLSSPIGNKVDKETGKGLSTNDYTTAEKTKLAGIAAGAQVNVINSISVNDTPVTPDAQGNVNIRVSGGDVSKVKIGSTEYTPNLSGVVDISSGVAAEQPTIDPTTGNWVIGGTVSQYPSKGQDGNSGVASGDEVESVNNLNGGKTDTQSKVYVLGANQGKRLRDQMEYIYGRLQAVYNALGNIAFWEGKTAVGTMLPSLDWGNPKHMVTISNSLSHSVITRNGQGAGSSFQAEEGSTVTLIVAPASGYALTSVFYVKDGGSSTSATSLGDGTYKIEFVMGLGDVTIAVSGTAVATIPITYGTPTHCSVPSGVTNPNVVASGGTVNVQYECDNGYLLSAADITVNGATIGTITSSGNVFTIPITHDGTSQSISISAIASALPIKLLKGYYIGTDIKINSLPAAVTNAAVGNGSTVDVDKVVLTDYIHISGNSNSSLQNYAVNCGVARGSQKNSQQGPPSVGSFFRKTNGAYNLITSWGWPSDTNNRTVTPTNFTSSGYGTEILNALQAGELYVRVALYLGSVNPDVLVNSCSIKWGGDTLFSALSNYTITTDTTGFDPFTYDGAPQ